MCRHIETHCTIDCVHLDLGAFAGIVPVEILGYPEFPPIGVEPLFLTLAALWPLLV